MKIEEVYSGDIAQFIFFDIAICERQIGRIVAQLFVKDAPNTCRHIEQSLPKYENTFFHKVLKNFVIHGGDVVNGKVLLYKEGKAGDISSNVSDNVVPDENLTATMDEPFLLCSASSRSSSQFFITTSSASHLQGKHTVFGKVIHGKSVVREIERVATTASGVPSETELPIIRDAGVWHQGDPVPIYNACYNQIGGDIYEEYPDDDETIVKGLLDSAYGAATIIKDSGGALFKTGDHTNALLKYKKALRYVMEYIPDEDQEPEFYGKFVELKKKIYLNLALVTLKLKDYSKSYDYGSFLLDMDLTNSEKAKTLYRMGSARFEQKKYDEAIVHYKEASTLVSDPSIVRDLEKAETMLKKKKDAEKAKYSKMFG
ncbi:hypothetical protein PUMCH_004815 [Australozyma saopauloensis]|uniref:peptidylprolyl isomerase n=1 Tax=Australozyma saopauloensis TaxID=291208 RepID=A0AAX4HFN7_9ASCO|nr:hypothetical protein PUMCH_004815 [[Candida] saopauloensis]